MNGSSPRIFVSSTCYDLRQVRQDLSEFIESLGCLPVLSDSPLFPVNPSEGTVENCLANVSTSDVLVLVVGNRYGSTTPDGKGITNLEYLEAKSSGMPIYIFVDSEVLANLRVWRQNRGGNFAGIVDSPKLFEFLDSIATPESWVFPFRNVQDIQQTLRPQIGYMLKEGLRLRARLRDKSVPAQLEGLSPKCMRLLLEKPACWEIELFRNLFAEEMAKASDLRWDVQYRIVFHSRLFDDWEELLRWSREKLSLAAKLATTVSEIIDKVLMEAMKPPGTQADAEGVVYAAMRLGRAYKAVLEWSLDFLSIEVDTQFQRLMELEGKMFSEVITGFDEFIGRLDETVEKAKSHVASGSKEILTFGVQLRIEIPKSLMSEINAEFKRLGGRIPGWNEKARGCGGQVPG